jgi:gliding motility-associated lipoprotein GldH
MKISQLVIIMGLIFASCDSSRISEMNKDFENRNWPIDSVAGFHFEVYDSDQEYSLHLNLRNTLNYPYQNIYIGYWLKDSLDQIILTNTRDLRNMDYFQLFDSKTGEPNGKGQGDILEHRFTLADTLIFEKPGKYSISFQQYMRDETLEGIVSVGYRLEKILNEDI